MVHHGSSGPSRPSGPGSPSSPERTARPREKSQSRSPSSSSANAHPPRATASPLRFRTAARQGGFSQRKRPWTRPRGQAGSPQKTREDARKFPMDPIEATSPRSQACLPPRSSPSREDGQRASPNGEESAGREVVERWKRLGEWHAVDRPVPSCIFFDFVHVICLNMSADRKARRRQQLEERKAEKKRVKMERARGDSLSRAGDDSLSRPSVHLPILQMLANSDHWQVAVQAAESALGKNATISTAANAVKRIGALMDRRLPGAFERTPVCQRGCSYCCHVQVEVSIPEVARAVEFAKEHFNLEEFSALGLRARASAEGARGKDSSTYPVQPCAFLVGGECSVYEARPLACRGEHSFDVETCKRAYDTGEDIPDDRDTNAKLCETVIRVALEERLSNSGFLTHTYELQQSLSIALSDPAAMEEWRKGKGDDPFAAARMGNGLIAAFSDLSF